MEARPDDRRDAGEGHDVDVLLREGNLRPIHVKDGYQNLRCSGESRGEHYMDQSGEMEAVDAAQVKCGYFHLMVVLKYLLSVMCVGC